MYCCVSCFFFKQKTAYEMRISDWSSDVCSSDLRRFEQFPLFDRAADFVELSQYRGRARAPEAGGGRRRRSACGLRRELAVGAAGNRERARQLCGRARPTRGAAPCGGRAEERREGKAGVRAR